MRQALVILAALAVLLGGCKSKLTQPSQPVVIPDAKPAVQRQEQKDDRVTVAAGAIDSIVEKDAPAVAVPVRVQTDEIRAAIASAPAAEVARLAEEFKRAVDLLNERVAAAERRAAEAEQRAKDAEDAEQRKQVATLRWAGLGALALAGLLGWAGQVSLAGAFGLAGILSLGLAQLFSKPWFGNLLMAAAGLSVIAIGAAIFHAYRKGDLAKKTAREAERLRGTLGAVIPTLDRVYDESESTVRELLDRTVFDSLSRKMDSEQKKVIHEVRANRVPTA